MKDLVIDENLTSYQIDEFGNIYNIKTQRFLKGSVYNTGYRMVKLTIKNKKKSYAVHRLVAKTFIPNPNNLPVVNHKDGNKLNNSVNNLEWVSYSENTQHCYKNNLIKNFTGKRNKQIIISNSNWKQYHNTNYLVSKDGRVYNTKTKNLLKTSESNGYARCSLRIKGKTVNKLIHSLVIETWLNKTCRNNEVINHIDGNKTNNNINNLEIVSKSYNTLHACYKLNKMVKPVSCFNDNAILIKSFPSITEAAKHYHITNSAIVFAIKNKTRSKGYYWSYK